MKIIDRSIDRLIDWFWLFNVLLLKTTVMMTMSMRERKKKWENVVGWLWKMIFGKITWIFRVHFHSRLSIFIFFQRSKNLIIFATSSPVCLPNWEKSRLRKISFKFLYLWWWWWLLINRNWNWKKLFFSDIFVHSCQLTNCE